MFEKGKIVKKKTCSDFRALILKNFENDSDSHTYKYVKLTL